MFGAKKEMSEQEAADQAQKYANKVNEDTVVDLVNKEDKIKGIFGKAENLKKYWNDACDIFSLIKERIGGTYTDTPWPTIAALAGALLYVFSPVDFIPDFIPFAGFIDDASVFGLVLMSANVDLEKYREWKESRKTSVKQIEASIDIDDTPADGTTSTKEG